MKGRRIRAFLMLALFVASTLAITLHVQPAKAEPGTIYIRADGSIDPLTANITSADNITYTFTDNNYDSIVIERDNIVVDGAGFTVQGIGYGTGIELSGRSNVTIKNMEVEAFDWGICLRDSSNNSIVGNNITNNWYGIRLESSSNNNTISENNITNNDYGIWLDESSNNIVYHNNFVDNTKQVHSYNSTNVWDDGYPSEGNYWSDYMGEDLDGDGVGETLLPHLGVDYYPLMGPWMITQGPMAKFTYSPPNPWAGDTVTFNASGSTPSWNGTHLISALISFEWNFGDGSRGEGITVSHTFVAAGEYMVTLNVTDSLGLWNTTSKTITFNSPLLIFEDDFESYDVGQFLGGGVSNPYGSWIGVGGQMITRITDSVSASPDQSVFFWGDAYAKSIGGWRALVRCVRVKARSPLLGFEVYVRVIGGIPGGTDDGVRVGFTRTRSFETYDGFENNFTVRFKNNGTIYLDDKKLQSYMCDSWYKIKVILDKPSKTYSVWINDILKANNLSFTEDPSELYNFFMYAKHGAEETNIKAYFDDITVFRGPYSSPEAKFAYDLHKYYGVTFDASSSVSGWNGITWVPIVNYTWNFGDSNTTTVNAPTITHRYTTNGTYTVNLTVTCENDPVLIEEDLTSDSTWKDITFLEYGPIAKFTYSPPYPSVNGSITFNASPSSSWNGTHYVPITSYTWDFGDGNITTVTDLIINHVYTSIAGPLMGTYTVTLNVTDSEGLWNTTSKTIRVFLIPPYNPIANFTYSPSNPLVDSTVTCNASSSIPGWNGTHDAPIVNYTWDFGDGTPVITGTDPITNHTYTEYGTYNVTLTVTDSQGLTDTAWFILTVREHPLAAFTHSPTSLYVNATVVFDASLSNPNGGSIVNYIWDFGDGTILIEGDPVATHNYTATGTYTVTLNVTDSEGLWNTTSKTIIIRPPAHDIAITDVTPSATEGYKTWTINISVKVENQGSYTESFTVTANYENATGRYAIGTKSVINLAIGTSTIVNFTWKPDASVQTCKTYTISANASIILGETDTTNNYLVDGNYKLKYMGDASNDNFVDVDDLARLGWSWQHRKGDLYYNPQCDFNFDAFIDVDDLQILGWNWQQGCP